MNIFDLCFASIVVMCFVLLIYTLNGVLKVLRDLNQNLVTVYMESIGGFETSDVPVQNVQNADVPEYNEPSSDLYESWEKDNASQRSTELTDYELARLEREAEFDLRISRMKDEMAQRLPNVERKGTVAPELHPNVHNLPHNIIPDLSDDLPDVEISE